jgi:hypothetical protein
LCYCVILVGSSTPKKVKLTMKLQNVVSRTPMPTVSVTLLCCMKQFPHFFVKISKFPDFPEFPEKWEPCINHDIWMGK